MRERMSFKEIRVFSKEKFKENLKVLIIIELIVVVICVGLLTWQEGVALMFPSSILSLVMQIVIYGLLAVFFTGSAVACLGASKGQKPKVEQVFYLFRNKTKQVLWLIVRKTIITFLITFIINFFGGVVYYSATNEDFPYMMTIASVLATVIVELRYFPALYLLLEGEEQVCRKAIWRGNDLMRGNYMRLMGLWISFVPWMLLGLIPCGLGVFVVAPWFQISQAVFYTDLKRQEKIKMHSQAGGGTESQSL